MDRPFWQARWDGGQIGFHQAAFHPFLEAFGARLRDAGVTSAAPSPASPTDAGVTSAAPSPASPTCYVPLAGKTNDLHWIAERLAPPIATEFVPEAVDAFFAEAGLAATVTAGEPFAIHRAGPFTYLRGDAFALTPAVLAAAGLARPTVAYDRAALVALAPEDRVRYVEGLRALLGDGGRVLLVVFDYDARKVDGPPWAIGPAEVCRLFAPHGTVELLAARPEPVGARYRAAGVTEIWERAYLVTFAPPPAPPRDGRAG